MIDRMQLIKEEMLRDYIRKQLRNRKYRHQHT
jgi:hypothetical protein